MCCYGIAHILLSFSTVGSTLHDPNHLHQEQPGHFILGLSGGGCERGGSFPSALVSLSSQNPWIQTLLVNCASSFLLNVVLVLCRSMLPDVVDDFKVKNPDIHGCEALFYSFYVFFIKFASGISLGVSTLSLKWVGGWTSVAMLLLVYIYILTVILNMYMYASNTNRDVTAHPTSDHVLNNHIIIQ